MSRRKRQAPPKARLEERTFGFAQQTQLIALLHTLVVYRVQFAVSRANGNWRVSWIDDTEEMEDQPCSA